MNMGIIKIEINFLEARKTIQEFQINRRKALENISLEIKQSISCAFNNLLNSEIEFFLGKDNDPFNKKNGYLQKQYLFKGLGALKIRVPVDRKRKFQSAIIPKYERIDPRVKEDLAVLHLAGLSTRTLELISKRFFGIEISTDTITGSLDLISDKATSWLDRSIKKDYWCLFIDGTNFKIQRRGSTEKEPSLVVVGVDNDYRRSILAIEPGSKENVGCWKTCFDSLLKRGFNPQKVRIGVMDGLPGLENAFLQTFPNSVTARCWKHALGNALNKTPARLRESFKMLSHKIMYANSYDEAKVEFENLKKAMKSDAEKAVHCLEKDLNSLLAHYQFDKSLWISLRTTNCVERVHKEFKRRTKIMEGVGEKTLKCVVAFTALKLEMGWRSKPVNTKSGFNLLPLPTKINKIEESMDALLH